jgi:RNA polymerase sigma-70 factor (ECF subfamily)
MSADVAVLPTEAAPLDTAAIFRAHAADVSRWVRALAGPNADTEDLIQEVFVTVHRRLCSFRGESAMSTWLFGITSNLVRRHRRVQKLRQWLGGTAEDVAGDLAATEPTAPELVAQAQARARVYRALDQLGHKYRTAIILFELEGRSAAEIAALCGVKTSAVWVWLHRGRGEFLRRLQGLEESEGTVR